MTGAGEAVTYAARRSKARAWLQLVRPHFIPFSVGAGIAGVAAGSEGATAVSVFLGLAMCAVGYPFGVIFNDLADREADAINAPDRPLVTGEVSPRAAVAALTLVGGGFLVAAAVVAPGLAIWSAIAIAGHFAYQATKGIPMVGNVMNGVDMALFCVIGAAGAAPDRSWLEVPGEVWAITGVLAVVVAGFCLVGYFKDVPGDRAAGYRTLPVVLGPERARWWALPFPVAAIALAAGLALADPGIFGGEQANAAFWVLLAATAATFALSMRELLRDPVGRAYEALVWTTRGMVLSTLALGAISDATLMLAVAAPVLLFLEATLRQTQRARQA